MSIARITITDDDGTGTTGTIWNDAKLTELYDDLDGRWSRATITSTGTQNNLSISEADFVVFNNATDLTITGIVAPAAPVKPGKPFRFVCIGAGNVFFAHQNASSTAANRLVNMVSSGNTPCSGGSASLAGGRGMYVYDDVNSRWQLVSHEQGAWITPTFAAGDYTAGGTQTWTVAAGDVATAASHLRGRVLTQAFNLNTTTVAGTPHAVLRRAIMGGFTATKDMRNPIQILDNNAAAFGLARVAAAGTVVEFYRDATTNAVWTASTDLTYIFGEIAIEVD